MGGDVAYQVLTGDPSLCRAAGRGYAGLGEAVEQSLEALYCLAADPSGAMRSEAGLKARQVAQWIAADLLAVVYVHRDVGKALVSYGRELDTAKQTADDALAALMTYILNPGAPKDYTVAGGQYDATPYSNDEIERIKGRQLANAGSYLQFTLMNGENNIPPGLPGDLRLVTTPYGTLMGVGGGVRGVLSQSGGTTYGDVFMINIDFPADNDGAQVLQNIIWGNKMPDITDPKGQTSGGVALNRVLHHEEIHSRQYERDGLDGFAATYLFQLAMTPNGDPKHILLEVEAGLKDGGYIPDG